MRIARSLLLLCALLPGCVKAVPGYCDVDLECDEDQFCRLPAHVCTVGERTRSCTMDNECRTGEICIQPTNVCMVGMRKPVCASNSDCRADQICLAPDCVDAIAAGVFSGAQALPPTPSTATGTILFYLQNNADMVYSITHSVASPTAVRLQSAKQGEVGAGVLFELKKDNGIDVLIGFPSDQITELAKGNLYVNIPSPSLPAGEVRAQIYPLSMGVTAGPTEFAAILSPLQTPLVKSSTASGRATVTLDEANSSIGYSVTFTIDPVANPLMGLHLHRGVFNEEGKDIADVTPVPSASPVTGQLPRSQFAQVFPEPAPLWSLLIRSGASYFNVHTTRESSGEIRGQLLPFKAGNPIAIAMPFNARLNPQGTSAATGIAQFFLSQEQTKLTWRLSHTALNPTSAQIIRNVTGVEVCPLSTGQDKSMGICDVKMPQTAASDLLLTDLQNAAGALTLVVKTAAVPGGELRAAVVAPKPQ